MNLFFLLALLGKIFEEIIFVFSLLGGLEDRVARSLTVLLGGHHLGLIFKSVLLLSLFVIFIDLRLKGAVLQLVQDFQLVHFLLKLNFFVCLFMQPVKDVVMQAIRLPTFLS